MEYGDEKSWTKELCMRKDSLEMRNLCPFKVFENGDILMEQGYDGRFLYYSSKTATIRVAFDWNKVIMMGDCYIYKRPRIYTPIFLSLNTFPMEYVCVLRF